MEQPGVASQQTQRQKFGEVLRFHREQRQLTTRRVADMCCVSREAVDNYESGHTVPDRKAWDKYKGLVNKRLGAFSELRQRALAEANAEREIIIRGMEQSKMATRNGTNGHTPPIIGTNLGDKLIAVQPISGSPDARTVNPGQAVTYHSVPPRTLKPTAEAIAAADKKHHITAGDQLGSARPGETDSAGRRIMPDRPPNAMRRQSIDERIAWTRLQFRQRPRMPVNGADGLLVMLRKRFGIGLDTATVQKIKTEVHAELSLLPPSVPAGVSPAAIPAVRMRDETAPHETASPSDDLGAAVQLVLGAVPGLRTFTINVDDSGEASVKYTVREVRVIESAGSMKVRR